MVSGSPIETLQAETNYDTDLILQDAYFWHSQASSTPTIYSLPVTGQKRQGVYRQSQVSDLQSNRAATAPHSHYRMMPGCRIGCEDQ